MKRNTVELKELLIQTGVEEIKNHGIEQLSLRTVAKACGVTHGAPYKHFGSKEGYLQTLLSRLSDIYQQNMMGGIDKASPGREQLLLMGFQFVRFAKSNPYIFEALFIKYPFNHIEIKENTIITDASLPGFENFKKIVIQLCQEESLSISEVDVLVHFWSFISGFAIIVKSPIGSNFDDAAIKRNIHHMLKVYIEGGK